MMESTSILMLLVTTLNLKRLLDFGKSFKSTIIVDVSLLDQLVDLIYPI
jgi:hypothetical protein